MSETQQNNSVDVTIRSFQETDQPSVSKLFTDGLLEGAIAPNDTGADVDNIAEAYLSDDRAHFWVADLDGKVVGMIGVAPEGRNIAEIRRLRVFPEYWGRGIRTKLLKMALAHCQHHSYLKVVLDTRFERGEALQLFEDFAFQHHRNRSVPGKEQLEFYMDLYREPKPEDE